MTKIATSFDSISSPSDTVFVGDQMDSSPAGGDVTGQTAIGHAPPVAAPEPQAPAVSLDRGGIRIGPNFRLAFNRTLRLPDDGRSYPLPPGLGNFPIKRVEDYADRVPASWLERGGFFIPMFQREALWLTLGGDDWRPSAVKMYAGGINAATGGPITEGLHADPQDYMVAPHQRWLDGFKTEDGKVRQFVAMPLGMGYTAEGQITGKEKTGGIQLLVYASKAGKFPDEPPHLYRGGVMRCASIGGAMYGSCDGVLNEQGSVFSACAAPVNYASDTLGAAARGGGRLTRSTALKGVSMGLAGGGRMEQKIYPDQYGIDTWDEESVIRVDIHIVNSMMYREITGEDAPSCPITPATYAQHGYPWFALYDEHEADLGVDETLKGLKSVSEMDRTKGFDIEDDNEAPIAGIVHLG